MRIKKYLSLGILISIILLLGMGYFLEYFKNLQPCPLCLLQRYAYYLIGISAIIALLPFWQNVVLRIGGFLIGFFSLIGGAIAAKQIWLQHLPKDQVPPCGPSMQVMLQEYHIPLWQVLNKVLQGSGDCAKVDWTFLSFSIAEWSLLCFLVFLMCGIYLLFAKNF